MATPATLTDTGLPTICLVGRVNVGKSRLFNRLIEHDKAIVSDIGGTTRTNNEGNILWRGKQIHIVDTGGLTFDDSVPFEDDIIKQSMFAIDHASVIIFVVDGTAGIMPQERELAKRLRKKGTPVILVANKLDSQRKIKDFMPHEWQALGFGEPQPISAANGRGVGDVLDDVFSKLQKQSVRPKKARDKDESVMHISLIGKPNAGKSSLFNKLIGQDKVIVSDTPHTTREPHDTLIDYKYKEGKREKKQKINFIDTAGIRRKSRVKGILEIFGIKKSIDSIEESDLILFVLDGSESISSQDKQLGGLIQRRGKSVIILVNKWDLAEDNSQANRTQVEAMVRSHFPHLDFAPLIFVSGLTGYRVHDIFPAIMKVWRARHTTIPDKALETFLEQIMKKHKPSRGKGTRHPKLLGLRQVGSAPPVFELFVKYRTSLHTSYSNFIKNKLREQFDFTGSPIIMKMRKVKQ